MSAHPNWPLRLLRLSTLLLVLGTGPCGCGDADSEEDFGSASSSSAPSDVGLTESRGTGVDSQATGPSSGDDERSSSASATSGPSGAGSSSAGTTPTEGTTSTPAQGSPTAHPATSSEPTSSSVTLEAGPAEPCDENTHCPDWYRCVYLDPSHALGVCSAECDTLGSLCGYYGPGTWAKCLLTLEDGTHACGYLCERDHGDHAHTHTCPSGDWGRLRCERQTRTGGHRYCAPRQP